MTPRASALLKNDFSGCDLMSLPPILKQRCMTCCFKARCDASESAIHSIAGPPKGGEVEQKMCTPKYLRALHQDLVASQRHSHILAFLCSSNTLPSRLSASSHWPPHGQEPPSSWVQSVQFQSLMDVIFVSQYGPDWKCFVFILQTRVRIYPVTMDHAWIYRCIYSWLNLIALPRF